MKKKLFSCHFWWNVLPFVGALVWGAFCISNNLWYDEAYSASMVSRSWYDLIYITAVDDHSPFYYVLLKIFYHLGGGGTHFQVLKLMSVLFMIGYLLLGKFYVKKLLMKRFPYISCSSQSPCPLWLCRQETCGCMRQRCSS